MGSMEGVLKEEYRRLKFLEKRYLLEIAKLPRGSLQEKRIKGVVYPYWVSSYQSKICYRYVGNLSDKKLKLLKEQLALRKKYQGFLKDVRRNQKQIRKIIHE